MLLLLIPTKHRILQWESDDHKGMYCPGPKILTFKLKKKQRKESKRKDTPSPWNFTLISQVCMYCSVNFEILLDKSKDKIQLAL